MRASRLLGLLGLVLVVLLGTLARVQGATRDPHFDREDPTGMLVTDPGVLFYLTRRTVEAGGLPEDLRADPRLQHPDRVDVLQRYTYGQELLVLAARRLVGPEVPLHVLCLWVFALVMAATAGAVYGLARELTGSHPWALGAAVWFALLPASYRTLGYVLMREDLAWPLLALHLWLAARAARRPTARRGALAGLALGLALASWHAMRSVALLEALAFLLASGIRRRPLLSNRAGAAGLATVALVCLVVPVLRAKGAVLSPAMALAAGLALGGRFEGWRRRAGVTLGVTVLLAGAGHGLSALQGTAADLRHVPAVLLAKIEHLGVRPADPRQLSFEARMMWQGPFHTLSWEDARTGFGFGFLALLLVLGTGARRAFSREASATEVVLLVGLVLALPAAWLVRRLAVLVALLLPTCLVRASQGSTGSSTSILPALGLGGLTFLQLVAFGSWLEDPRTWYRDVGPPEVAAAVRAVEEHVPSGEAVAADFLVSTALLAHSYRPIVLEPKWEAAASRERVRRFWHAFHHQGPEKLARLLRERWRTRWLLLDRRGLWWNPDARYLAGLGSGEPPRPGTAAEAFGIANRERPEGAPAGYSLVWAGPDAERPRFRLYALE